MDTTPLRDAYRALLDAAGTVAEFGDTTPAPPPGEWDADQILAHVSLVNAAPSPRSRPSRQVRTRHSTTG